MPNDMSLVITLRKTVPDQATAETLTDAVKNKLAEYPDVVVTAHTTNRFEPPPEP